MVKLSDNFLLEELTVSESARRLHIDNEPPPIVLRYMQRYLAPGLEEVRVLLGNKPIIITSGYRSPALNATIGGSRNSDHCRGLAVDFTCWGFGTPYAICKEIEHSGIKFRQLILEFGSWVHIAFGLPGEKDLGQNRILTIYNKAYGYRVGIRERDEF